LTRQQHVLAHDDRRRQLGLAPRIVHQPTHSAPRETGPAARLRRSMPCNGVLCNDHGHRSVPRTRNNFARKGSARRPAAPSAGASPAEWETP
jgi:hypothetical protein